MAPQGDAHSPEGSIETIDGAHLEIRPIHRFDSDALEAAFLKLSPESRYRRFLHAVNSLGGRELDYLTHIDHEAHEALIALRVEEIVGVARFIRDDADPERAEVAVTVADEWQGRGVGTALLHRLADRAVGLGVQVFTAICLDDNSAMLDLFRELGATTSRSAGPGAVAVSVELAGSVVST